MSDLVAQLRARAVYAEETDPGDALYLNEAADEIERLRAEIKRIVPDPTITLKARDAALNAAAEWLMDDDSAYANGKEYAIRAALHMIGEAEKAYTRTLSELRQEIAAAPEIEP